MALKSNAFPVSFKALPKFLTELIALSFAAFNLSFMVGFGGAFAAFSFAAFFLSSRLN